MIHWVGWRNEPETNSFFFERSCHRLILQLNVERVNIRPRIFFLEI
jgi:hypothetical protein